MKQIFIDTETTGLSPERGHRICEVAAIEYENEKPTGRTFHEYINPQKKFDAGASKVTGYTLDDFKGKPVWADINESLCDFLAGSEILAHNADFDTGFIVSEQVRCNSKHTLWDLIHNVINTETVFRKYDPGHRSYSLDNVMKRFDVNAEGRDLHGALIDTQLLAETYYKVLGESKLKMHDYTKLRSRQPVSRIPAAARKSPGVVVRATGQQLESHKEFISESHPSTPQAGPSRL